MKQSSKINCQLVIDHITLFMQNNNSKKLTDLIVKSLSGIVFKQLPLQLAVGSSIQIQSQLKLQIIFSLLKEQNGGKQSFAQGYLILQQQINPQKSHQFNISLFQKNTNIQIADIRITIKIDDQKISWRLAQVSQNQESELQRMTQKYPNRYKSVRQKYKRNKGRRLNYQLRDQNSHTNIEIINKITDNFNFILQSFKLQYDQPLQYVKFSNKVNKEVIAQIFCNNNPSYQELRKVRLKIPASLQQIQVNVRTKDRLTFKTEIFLEDLNNDEVKAIGLELNNQKTIKKGRFWFNYKMAKQDQFSNTNQIIDNKSHQKLLSSPSIKKQLQFENDQKSTSSLRIMQFLNNKNTIKKYKSRINQTKQLLPQINSKSSIRNKQSLTSMTVNQKILPIQLKKTPTHQLKAQKQDQQSEGSILKYYPNRNYYSGQKNKNLQNSQTFLGIKIRNKTIQNDRVFIKQYIVSITQVNVKFYTSFLTSKGIRIQKDIKIGKFIQIYSQQSHIFRSDYIYGSQSLNWIIKSCQIKLNLEQNITMQICSTKQNKKICKKIISFQELKKISDQKTFYRGHIVKNNEYIAKIIIEFRIKENQQKNYTKIRPILQSKVKRTINYDQDQYNKKDKGKNISLHEGGAYKYVYFRRH